MLLKIASDMFEVVETEHVVIRVPLDLSTSCDAVDHIVLARKLEQSFGINDHVTYSARSAWVLAE